MSGLLDKAKDAIKGGSSSGKNQGGAGAGGQQSGIEKGISSASHTQIDNATDRAGLGDKYDDKINKFADGQINKNVPGGATK